MSSPRDYYRTIHPDYFSDSCVEAITEVDRSMMEFHLSSITTRSQEADFERFARRICERTICPNLLPATGPTGGGDSKADAETYPVADSVAFNWLAGVGREAAEERWAFAISAKKVWQSKLRSDVKKIVDTRRGYTKAFFVTNQPVSSKKRSALEDNLRTEYSLDVRILDQTWILEKVFGEQLVDIAVAELKVNSLSRLIPRIGPNDARRQAELASTEERIVSALTADHVTRAIVDDALDAAELARALERPTTAVEGMFARAERFAEQFGSQRQKIDAAYHWAWTLFVWLNDRASFLKQYDVVEAMVDGSHNVHDFELMLNLWILMALQALNIEDFAEWGRLHTARLREQLKRLIADPSRPSTALQAHACSLKIDLIERLRMDEQAEDMFEAIENVLKQAEGMIGFPVQTLVKVLTMIGPMVGDSAAYNRLFSAIVELSGTRDGEVAAARLLINRGEQYIDQDRPARAIAMIGQALTRLYKHETRDEIVTALALCGGAYERVGMVWAARASYINGAGIAAQDFWTHGTISGGLIRCVNRLKWVELRLARLPHLMAFQRVEIALRANLRNKGLDLRFLDEDHVEFDVLLAHMLLHTPDDELLLLERLPDVLSDLTLVSARVALLHMLGYPDELDDMAATNDVDGNKLATELWRLEVDVPLPDSLDLYAGDRTALVSTILGCQIVAICLTVPPCVEVGAWILAILEGFLSTSSVKTAYAFEPTITIEIVTSEADEPKISLSATDRLGHPHFVVSCDSFNPYKMLPQDQAVVGNTLFKLAIKILFSGVAFHDMEISFEALVRDERAVERAVFFTGSATTTSNVLGTSPPFHLSDWITAEHKKYPSQPCNWTPPSDATAKNAVAPECGQAEQSPNLIDRDLNPHQQIEVISHIRAALWDEAEWLSPAFGWEPDHSSPPLLGIVFRNRTAGTAIFAAWRKEIGDLDARNELGITIVRGISKRNPFAYRLLLGANLSTRSKKSKVALILKRFITADPVTDLNLNTFLADYAIHHNFLLAPAFLQNGVPEPLMDHAILLRELNVREAWQIGLYDHDSVGIMPDDDIIIPAEVSAPPVHRLQQWKRDREGRD